MDLYELFFQLNSDLYEAGVRMPFEEFLKAIHRGLSEDQDRPVFIAGDGGPVNPLNMLRDRELVFVAW